MTRRPVHTLRALAARPSARVGMALSVAFAAVWALLELFVGRLHGAFHVIQIEGLRFAVQLLLMLAVWGRRAGAPLWRTQRPWLQLARAAFMLGIPLGFGVAVAQGASVATALTGLWLAPLFALGLARWWLRDRVPLVLWALAAAGLLGAAALLSPTWPASLLAVGVPALMGLSFAVYLALTRRLRHEPVQTSLFYLALGSFAMLLPLLPMVWVRPSLHDAALLVAIGLFGYAALWLLEEALRRWSLSHVAPVLYVNVACMTLASSSAYGRMPSLRLLAGLTLVGLVAVWLWRRAAAQDRARAGATSSPLVVQALGAVGVKGTP